MSTKPNLVLDIAGVIATNFSPLFWKDLSSNFDIPYENLVKFKKDIRKELWTGRIEEKEFWVRLKKEFPIIELGYAKSVLKTTIKPLPAIKNISTWSKYANIHLLSNHRIEWVEHIFTPVQDYIKSITISSNVGCCKPQADIYLKVRSNINNQKSILFVDDQEKNLIEARNLGWNTLLADEKGVWTEQVINLL